jgi:outer membrane lipoprotein carrier protein
MFYRYLLVTVLLLSSLFASYSLTDIKSFKADFVQSVINESNKKIEYKGKLAIKENGKVLWRYQDPIIKNVYVDNNMVIVDEPELEQAIYTTLDKGINIVKLLKDAVKVDKNKYKSRLYNKDYFLTFENNKIKKIEFKDELENRVTIKFSNIEENVKIDEKLFKFTPPEYYDIIRK